MADKIPDSKVRVSLRFKKIHNSEMLGMLNSGKVEKFLIPQEEAGKYYFINNVEKKAYEIKERVIFQCGGDDIEEKKNRNCVYVREDTNVGEVIDLLMDEEMAEKF